MKSSKLGNSVLLCPEFESQQIDRYTTSRVVQKMFRFQIQVRFGRSVKGAVDEPMKLFSREKNVLAN